MPDLSQSERAYLAGLWDGEGSITLWKHKRKEGKERLIASLVFTNTNKNLIAWVESAIEKIGATFHKLTLRYDRSKDCYQLTARNRESIKRTIRIMLPFLVAKKEQAQIVLAFVLSREEAMRKSKGRPSNTCPYSEKEFKMERQIRTLNRLGKGKSPETIRQTVKTDDMAHPS